MQVISITLPQDSKNSKIIENATTRAFSTHNLETVFFESLDAFQKSHDCHNSTSHHYIKEMTELYPGICS